MRRVRFSRLVLAATGVLLAALVWRMQRAADEVRRVDEPRGRERSAAPDSAAAAGPATPASSARERARAPASGAQSEPTPGPSSASAEPAPAALTVRGRVVDDLGSGWCAFRLRAERLDGSGTRLERAFGGAGGQFELPGFTRGDWLLTATSAEGLDSEPVRLHAPSAGPLALVIARAARVSGFVLAPTGQRVSGV